MAQKDLNYRITGDSSGLTRATDEGSRALAKMEREARRLERQQAKLHNAMTTTGRGMALAGAAIAAGLALSARAAIEWESAWAGVLKTVDGTPEQMAALEEEIRGLTAVLPATHTEIAAVAEAAGQLGVQRQNIAAFTRTMIDMGEATNLSSDEAATALARFMNIMQTAPDDVNRLASAIVDLGNKGATTESEITAMALRIAGAGRTIGLSEQQVLGFAAALSNVGINAEAGGTAISKVFLEIDKSVKSGDENLTTFAQTAGMSAEQFARAYEQDAGGAIASFVAGLGQVQASGGDVNAVLSQLGLTEIRVSDALRRLAGSGDNLTGSLALSNAAWDENTALAEEAERRYGTTAAKLSIARNQVNDFAISIGEGLLPVLGDAAATLSEMLAVVGDMPGPVKTAITVVGVLGAGLLLLGGAALILIPRIAATKAALDTLAASAGRTAIAARGLQASMGFMLGPWGAVIAAAATVATIAFGAWTKSTADARRAAQEIAETLDELTGAFTDVTRAKVTDRLESDGALEAAQRLGLELTTVVDAVLGEKDALEEVNRVLAENTTKGDEAAGTYDAMSTDAATLAKSVQGLSSEVDAGVESWRRTTDAAGTAGGAMAELDPVARSAAESLGIGADTAAEYADAADELGKELDGLFSSLFSVEQAEDAAAEAMRRLTEEAKANGGSLQGNSEAAIENRENVRDLISADFDLISAMAEAGVGADDLADRAASLKEQFVEQAREAGLSEEAIEEYAAAYDEVPSVVDTKIRQTGVVDALTKAQHLADAIGNIPRNVVINYSTSPVGPIFGPAIARQHGGPVPGPMSAPTDSQLMALTPGEFVIRKGVAQQNMAALAMLNATGRWPGGTAGSSPVSVAAPNVNVKVFVDGQEFRGMVRVEVDRGVDAFGNALLRGFGQGVGGAR